MTTIEEIITDEEIESVWGNADFGDISKRDVIRFALLKYLCNYSSGHTAECILRELCLITPKDRVSSKGRQYIYLAFSNNNSL